MRLQARVSLPLALASPSRLAVPRLPQGASVRSLDEVIVGIVVTGLTPHQPWR